MTTLRPRIWIPALAALLLSTGCATRAVDPATLPADDLHGQAMAAYQAGDHKRAIPLLSAFVQSHLGDPRTPEVLYTLGRARMSRQEYLTAISDFNRLATDFPSHARSRDARYGMCEAYTLLSPKPALDQEYTRAAITHCESVASLFPGTEIGDQAAAAVQELRVKLARKAYETGEFYFRRGLYDASLVYFEEVLARYPGTPVAATALQRMVDVYTAIGYEEEAAEARQRLLSEYPSSPEAQALRG